MSSYVPATLRRSVALRAGGICEYCLIPCADTFFGCSMEHIIAEKHGGKTVAENLAIACLLCNRFKGSDISSISSLGKLCRLYNPRLV
jgi:5-methylcytosine-specific restriction endonuclease McrA